MSSSPSLMEQVVRRGLCTGCGACVACAKVGKADMRATPKGPVPFFEADADARDPLAWAICPGRGIPYLDVHEQFYGRVPENHLTGPLLAVRTGYAADPVLRRAGASGGVTTAVLVHLLETGRIDAAIVVKQGEPTPDRASAVFARTREEIIAAAQSVYIPVSVLDRLRDLEPGKRYAMTCLPDQAATLRRLQVAGFAPARQVEYVLGPYTGTALYPAAIRCLLRSHKIRDDDAITSLQWRAGEWPGYLEIQTASGRVVKSKKVYYNFLIPFFVTRTSLLYMDFANEFCDLSVGDAWSPAFEASGGGHSVVVTRSEPMERVVCEMRDQGHLSLQDEDPLKASEMHGHMIDFKKRGSYIRIRLRRMLGLPVPDHACRPLPLPASRWGVEAVVSGLFICCGNPIARKILEFLPESIMGPVFNRLRLSWKSLSKPTKRKGLQELTLIRASSSRKVDDP